MSDEERLFERYRELQAYVSWDERDAARVGALADFVEPFLGPIIDDFYEEIARHPDARKVITGGPAQIDRLKGTLHVWIRELFSARYDASYVTRRWRVGWRHVEIGLDQVYTNVALSRIRTGLLAAIHENWRDDVGGMRAAVRSLNKLLDLDLAIIEDAYQTEYLNRQQRIERLATIGQVAGGVAHELRNPLNVVKTSVYYLLNARNPTEEKKAEHLRRIERHVGLADGVITALSSFARMPLPTARAFDLEPCLAEVLERNPVGDGIEVAIDCPASLPRVSADANQLQLVFGNLIRNASDAMPDGGRLAVSGRLVGEQVEVLFADTGIGIPLDQLSRIMEPLYTTKAKGLGLGLAIARTILEKNHGSLAVASEAGRGSTFTVWVPAAMKDDGDSAE